MIVFTLAAVAFFALPFILSLVHASHLRRLQTQLEKISARLALLEFEVRVGKASSPESTKSTVSQPPPVPTSPPVSLTGQPISTLAKPVQSGAPQGDWRESSLPRSASAPVRAAINWEAFMGIKLFAWIGGFALFLGIVFLVKYSFENNLITARTRIAIGLLAGAALIVTGWLTASRRYRVTGESLCATGVLVLYANIFAAYEFYNLISLALTFILMSCVTLVAFGLAVRLSAQVVVILGLVGGFLTPILLATGRDNANALFGYITFLDLGIAAVALRKRWEYLILLAAVGTFATEIRWVVQFFDVPRAPAALVIFLGFETLFLAIAFVGGRLKRAENWTAAASAVVGIVAQLFCFSLLFYQALTTRPLLLFLWLFLSGAGLLALAKISQRFAIVGEITGSASFLLLALWSALFLNLSLLWWALGGYLCFALLHGGCFPWSNQPARRHLVSGWVRGFALMLVALIIIAAPLRAVSLGAWFSILLLLTVGMGFATSTPALLAIIGGLVLAILVANLWVLAVPLEAARVSRLATSLTGFGMCLLPASIFTGRSLRSSMRASELSGLGGSPFGAVMPFVLLLIAIARLSDVEATPIFATLFLLAVLLLGVSVARRFNWPGAVALACTWPVESAWHAIHFSSAFALLSLAWYVVLLILFVAYPFFCANKDDPLPFAISAVAAAMQFWLIYQTVLVAYPNSVMGLLPAAFVLLPASGIFYLTKILGVNPRSGDARLAWQGGVALLFVSLILPIQFDREWITLGWAVEGVALLILFRAVPNRGLRVVSMALLCLAFVRLAFNPAVLEYHKRAPIPIWNWYLYAYGITSACLFAGGKLFGAPREWWLESAAPRFLYALGAILVFVLLNIEIADYFSIGPTITFSFEGNFARDMAYSIAWALYAFLLLLAGMRKKTRAIRYGGLALLALTLLKLFLHDLGSLGQLYRIGAFIGVAVILIIVSFVYQRFLATGIKES